MAYGFNNDKTKAEVYTKAESNSLIKKVRLVASSATQSNNGTSFTFNFPAVQGFTADKFLSFANSQLKIRGEDSNGNSVVGAVIPIYLGVHENDSSIYIGCLRPQDMLVSVSTPLLYSSSYVDIVYLDI